LAEPTQTSVITHSESTRSAVVLAEPRGFLAKDRRGLSTAAVVAIILLLGVAAAAAGVLAVWYLPWGSEQTTTRAYPYSGFSQIDISTAFVANVTQSPTYSVSVTAAQAVLDHVAVSKIGNTLSVSINASVSFFTTPVAVITMPELTGVNLSGASHVTAQGFSIKGHFTAGVTGASSLELASIAGANLTVDLEGASSLSASGQGENLLATVDGASTLNLSALPMVNANVNVSGASRASVDLTGLLNADVSGASTLTYFGQPALGAIETSGASVVTKA
jgi:hypothetical protein